MVYQTQQASERLFAEGRRVRGNNAIEEMPVFDKGRSLANDPALRIGLGARTAGGANNLYFTRNDRDRRPGTPVPCGEPHPDRLAIAEAIRRQIEMQEGKWKLPDGGDLAPGPKVRGNYRKSSSRTPDIDTPLGRYVAATNVVIIARRGGQTLHFASPRDAVLCITGEPATQSGLNAVTNAANGVVRGAYGWTFERVGQASRAKLQYQK